MGVRRGDSADADIRVTVDGGAGFDLIDLDRTRAQGGVIVSLARSAIQQTGAGRLQVADIEALSGTEFADTLTGNDAANALYGGAAADILNGGVGDDVLHGDLRFAAVLRGTLYR